MLEVFEMIADATVILSVLLALAIVFKFLQLSYSLKLVGIYLIVGASFEIISSAFFSVARNNLIFLHVFTFFEIVFLSHFFHYLFKNLKSKLQIYYVAIPFIIFVIGNTLFVQKINELNSYSSMLTSIFIMGCCIHFFILILDFKSPNIQFATLKLFVICLFIFHSMSLGFMLFGDVFNNLSTESESIVWSFRSIVMLATKVVLLISFGKLFLKNSKLAPNE